MPPVLHWRDFVCPFCYVGQSRTAALRARGLIVDELPFRIHPEIPPEGLAVGERIGPMYDFLEREAAAVGLPLRWPARLPDTTAALSAADWVRRHAPAAFAGLDRAIFAAHFAEGQDIGDVEVLKDLARRQGLTPVGLAAAFIVDRTAIAASEALARRSGVTGTPAWLSEGELIEGLQPMAVFA